MLSTAAPIESYPQINPFTGISENGDCTYKHNPCHVAGRLDPVDCLYSDIQ
jgi:hypothetical protein